MMKKSIFLGCFLGLCTFWGQAQVEKGTGQNPYFRIEVIDAENNWPVPLVEFKTVENIRFVTDNAGVIAFYEPDLMGKEVWFDITSHGYSVPKDGFGYRGARLKPVSGGKAVVKVNRDMIAKRLGRLTGSGLFAESQKCGTDMDWQDAGVVGCDTVQTTPYKDHIFWAWGDTSLSHYPLGIFNTSAAKTPLPETWAYPGQPLVKIKYDLFKNQEGKPRGVIPLPSEGPIWIGGTLSLKDKDGKEHLCTVYSKIKNFLQAYEKGLAVWNDEKEEFESVKVLWNKSSGKDAPSCPEGNQAFYTDEQGVEWVYFGSPLPNMRCRAIYEAWLEPENWESVSTPRVLSSVKDGTQVRLHSGSMQWSEHKKRWVSIFVEQGGSSFLGEVWYTEAPSPTGPWKKAVKVITHDHYTFYNPRLHPELLPYDSTYLLLEGSYSKQFSGNEYPTARYDYNQVLYRVDLDDPELKSELFE